MTQVNSLKFRLQRSDLLRARATASSFDPHLHSTYSVVLLKSGAASIRSARWNKVVHAGDVFFFNPYEVHAATSGEEPAEYETLYPTSAFVGDCIAGGNDTDRISIQTDVLSRTRQTQGLTDALCAPVIDGAAVEDALRNLLRACVFATETSPFNGMSVALRACRFIKDHCAMPLRTNDLATKLGVHQSHLIRAFRSATSMAPQNYIRQVRVARALHLLFAGVRLSEIAPAVGFCDQAHLTREFKKVFGVAPGVLSREVGSKHQRDGNAGTPAL